MNTRTLYAILALIIGPAVHSANLTLFWTAVGDDGTSGTASAYELIYSTDSAAVAASNSGVAGFNPALGVIRYADSLVFPPSPSGTPESLIVVGLVDGMTYFFAIKAFDDSLYSAGYNIARGVLPDTIPPASIMDLRTSP